MAIFGIIFFIGLLLGILRINMVCAEVLPRHISNERVVLRTSLTVTIAIVSLTIPFVLYAITEIYKDSWVSWLPVIVACALALFGFVGIVMDYVLFFKRKRQKTA